MAATWTTSHSLFGFDPKSGMIVLTMGTTALDNRAAAALFSKTRRAVLSLLFGRPEESFYLREIVRAAGAGNGSVQRELRRLEQAGLLRKSMRANLVFFQANPACPIFAELRSIMLKTVGVADVLREALAPLASRIESAFVFGSVARGEHRGNSDVDVCIIGDVTFGEVVAVLSPTQDKLGREVNPTVHPPAEFAGKLAQRHYFVASLARGPKMFVIGGEHAFAALAER